LTGGLGFWTNSVSGESLFHLHESKPAVEQTSWATMKQLYRD